MNLRYGIFIRYLNKKCIEKIGKISEDYSIGDKYVVLDNGKTIKIEKIISEWKPHENETCIFFNKEQKSFRIAKFKQIAHGQNRSGLFKDKQGNFFDNCFPFTNQTIKYIKLKLKD